MQDPAVPGPSGGRKRPPVRPGRGTTVRAGSRAGHQRNAPGRGRVQLAQRTISRNPAAFGATSVITAASPALPRRHAAAGPWLCRPLPLFGSLPRLSFPPRTPLCSFPSFLLLRGPPGRSRDPAPVPRSRDPFPVRRSRDPPGAAAGGDVPQTGGQGPARRQRQEGPPGPPFPRRTGPGPRSGPQRRPRRAAPGPGPQAAGGAGRWVSAAAGDPSKPGAGESCTSSPQGCGLPPPREMGAHPRA